MLRRRSTDCAIRAAVALAPAALPFALVAVAPRWEAVAVAAVVALIVAPGALVAAAVTPADHPLAHPAARPAVALIAALVPAAIAALIGTRLHWRLDGVVALWAALAAPPAVLAAVRVCRARRTDGAPDWAVPAVALDGARARVALAGFALVFAGVAYANQWTRALGFAMLRIGWWDGYALGPTASDWIAGAVVAAIGAIVVAAALWRPSRGTLEPPRRAWPIWVVAGALVAYAMLVTYRLPPTGTQLIAPWNLDDVSYVAEAVDAAHDVPLATEEPSLSIAVDGRRATVSVLGAPVVAAITRATGVGPAALHHTLLPPIVVAFGASALAAALLVMFRRHPQAVPLGLAAALGFVLKSWDYPGSLSEYLLHETAQPKSVHLWLVQPLQLAVLLLVIRRPCRLHAGAAVAVAVVGHAVHPFATVVGAVWTAVALAVAVATRSRCAGLVLAALLAGHGALALEVWSGEGSEAEVATDRVAGEVRESRDLVREDDRPTHRQDPRLLFAGNVGFALATAATAIAVALGRRRRELAVVAAISAVAVAACTLEPVGRVLGLALHPAILWRARWLMPTTIAIALLVAVFAWAIAGALPTRVRAFAPAIALAMFAAFLATTHSLAAYPGPEPERLDKLTPVIAELVEPLGGTAASPFVLGPSKIHRELPQLMPHLRLPYSLPKLVRKTHPPATAFVGELAASFDRGTLTAAQLDRALALYPIDRIVVDDTGSTAGVVAAAGWRRTGGSGRYSVWSRP